MERTSICFLCNTVGSRYCVWFKFTLDLYRILKFSAAAGNRLATYYMGPKHTGVWYIGTPLLNPSGYKDVMYVCTRFCPEIRQNGGSAGEVARE